MESLNASMPLFVTVLSVCTKGRQAEPCLERMRSNVFFTVR